MLSIVFFLLSIITLLYYLYSKKSRANQESKQNQITQIVKPEKQNHGQIQILYASQTGTAAKMASNFGQEAQQHGFQPIVIDLNNLSHNQFKKNQISVFFMANTGQGQPPQNCVKFMKMLQGKQDLEGATPSWKNMNYAVFGLGDTQYQHFNKIGRDTDTLLQKLGAVRIAKIGLGDANSSLEDDYIQWKADIWQQLVSFRKQNPYSSGHTQRKESFQQEHQLPSDKIYLSEIKPQFANFRFCLLPNPKQKIINENQLDFKTKASLLGKQSKITNIIQKRQDKENGSSLQLQVVLQNQPEYQTAGNIALWPTNDPQIVNQVIDYFKLKPQQFLQIEIIDQKKRNKFNFISPLSIRQLLENHLDLQFRITKGLLKKLSKFPSKSSEYFLTNSSAKTTDQYKRLSQKQFCYLFKLVKEYQVQMSFEDFVELSDSVGARVFTIASSWKAQKNVVVVASIVQNGLISKHFQRNPRQMKAQLRKSSFTDIMRWKKVIFIGAGTGFAPFRGFLQQKQLALKDNKEAPIITLYFGCRYKNSDFIYRQQIMNWSQTKVINKLNLAFSRQTQQKIYVQNLLEKQIDQVKQFVHNPQCAVYICGSVGMGKDVTKVFEDYLVSQGSTIQQSKKIFSSWQKQGRMIKQLW